MFNKFTTILQQAVEALAPDAPLHEDFVYHWKSVTNFYIENTDDKTPVRALHDFHILNIAAFCTKLKREWISVFFCCLQLLYFLCVYSLYI